MKPVEIPSHLQEHLKSELLFGNGRGRVITIIVMVLLLVLPLYAWHEGNKFYLDFLSRIICLGIAAASLNLILGYGGMVSFGHAAFIGIGAYAVGIPAHHGYESAWLHFPLAIGLSAAFALLTGAISLRTRGVYFIMITMAFAQMAYYFFLSLEEYGGDDGMTLWSRSDFGFINLSDGLTFFVLCYGILALVIYCVFKIVNSRFGMVLRGCNSNEQRMKALGYNVYAYRLTAYVISGAICGLSGALMANLQDFITADTMTWTRSGELMFMVILGGAGTLFGPVFGAVAFLGIEEVFSAYTIYWQLPFGILLILSVLFIKGGVNGLIQRGWQKDRKQLSKVEAKQ